MKDLTVFIYESLSAIEKVDFLIDYFQKIKNGETSTIDPTLLDQFIDMTFEGDANLESLFDFLRTEKNFSKPQAQSIIDGMKSRGFRGDMIKFLAMHNGPESDRLYFSQLYKNTRTGNLIDVISSKYDISPEFVKSVCTNVTRSSAAVGEGEMAIAIFCNDAKFDDAQSSKGEDKADIRIVGERSKGIEVKCGTWQPKGQKNDFAPNTTNSLLFVNAWVRHFNQNESQIKHNGGLDLYKLSGNAKSKDIGSAICELASILLPSKWLENELKRPALKILIKKQDYQSGQDINRTLLALSILCYHASEKFNGIFMLSKNGAKGKRAAYDYIYVDDFAPDSIFAWVVPTNKDAKGATDINLDSNMTCIPKMNAESYLNK